MKKVETIGENKNYTAVNVGKLEDIASYSLIHPKLKTEIKGKVFLKDSTLSTGTELSFTSILAKSEIGYFHIHNKVEETYVILRGSGLFQVDNECFPVKEGSVIRVAPRGVRSIRNTSNENMIYICIQSKENSLEEYTAEDGTRIDYKAAWL